MVLIDTDVFLIEFRYTRDARFQANSLFLSNVLARRPCITVYNLMEFLGQMSFNLAPAKLAQWGKWLRDHYSLAVLWPEASGQEAASFFHKEVYEGPFSRMLGSGGGMAFLDALIIGLGERTPGIEAFVTWNARHFVANTSLNVMTPQEYVQVL